MTLGLAARSVCNIQILLFAYKRLAELLKDKANNVEFSAPEALFYAASFMASGAASFARILRDNEPVVGRVVFGRCLSAGFTSFGIVALWIGRDPNAGSLGGFYWLAIAALIGYTSKDLHDRVLAKVIEWLLSKFGSDDKKRGE